MPNVRPPALRSGFSSHCRLAIVAAVTVCAGGAASQEVGGSIEYGYWGNAKRTELTNAVSAAFMHAYPGTTVNGIVAEYQAYIERLTVQAAAGELPCVTQLQSTFLATYASRGVLRPLDDLVASGAIDVSGIPPEVLENGKYDGELYMIPTGIFVRLIAYNEGMLSQYGIDPLPERASFADYRDWLLQAQAKLPSGIYAAEADGAWLFTLDSWVAGHGQPLYVDGKLGFDQAVLTEYLTFWRDLDAAGAVTPADRLDEQFGAMELRPLARGRALSATRDIPQIIQASATLKAAGLPSDIRLARAPVEEGASSGNVPGANGLAISESCDNVPTAAAYIDFFSNDPAAAIAFQSANGVVVSEPARKALLDNAGTPPEVRSSLEVLQAVVADGDLSAITYPPGYQALQGPMRRAYESVMLQGGDPAEVAEQFFRDAARALR